MIKQLPKPTSAELEILNILWEKGPSPVSVVHDYVRGRKPTHYTTILKLMQIMHEKGLVKRNESGKAHIYRAAVTEDQTQTNLVADLLERAFRGSASKLVQHVLEAKAASADELAEIRRMIEEAAEGGKTK